LLSEEIEVNSMNANQKPKSCKNLIKCAEDLVDYWLDKDGAADPERMRGYAMVWWGSSTTARWMRVAVDAINKNARFPTEKAA